MKRLIFLILFAFSIDQVYAQIPTDKKAQFNELNKHLMLSLGSWSVSNFIGSGIGWGIAERTEWKSFHQMNVFWNAVNFGLALPGYFKANKGGGMESESDLQKEQLKTERLFLVNSGLDLVYMTSGALLINTPDKKSEYEGRNLGFGRSIILQGGFLLAFDATAYLLHRRNRIKNDYSKRTGLTCSPYGAGLRLTYNF